MTSDHRLLILSCSQRKRPDRGLLPALERYDGPVFRMLRKFLRSCSVEESHPKVYILSVQFGLIPAHQPISHYDCRMTPQQASIFRLQVLDQLRHILRNKYYEPIAERLFTEMVVDTFLLEYDTDRAGGFEPLRFVPPGKTVVLGLVTTKEPQLESLDALRRRVDEASRYVPLEYLALSPQCGFASVAAGNLLSWDEQRRKLELVVDTARQIWA